MDEDDSLEGLKSSQSIKRDTKVVHMIKLPKLLLGFLGGSAVKYPPEMQGMPAVSLGQKYPLEKEMATHFSFLAHPVDNGSWQATAQGFSDGFSDGFAEESDIT